MIHELLIDDETATLEILGRRPFLRLRIDGREHVIEEAGPHDGATVTLRIDDRVVTGFRFVTAEQVWIRLEGRTFVIGREGAAGARARKGAGRGELRADMPGTVVAIHVREGQEVRAGDPILTLESMKLQLTLAADHDATIARVLVRENATFERGAVLVVLGAASGGATSTPTETP